MPFLCFILYIADGGAKKKLDVSSKVTETPVDRVGQSGPALALVALGECDIC